MSSRAGPGRRRRPSERPISQTLSRSTRVVGDAAPPRPAGGSPPRPAAAPEGPGTGTVPGPVTVTVGPSR